MNEPLVSVIIPCHNHGRFLGDAVGSVQGQTYRNHQVVVVDDGSTDDTATVAASLRDVIYLRRAHGGPSAARNTGLNRSHGDLVVFLDADDMLLPRALDIGVRLLTGQPRHAFVSGRFRMVAGDGRVTNAAVGIDPGPDRYLALLRGNFIGMQATVLFQRWAVEACGGYDERTAACEDYELYLKIARTHPVLHHPEIVADYRWHGGNMSRDPRFMLRWALEVLRREQPYAFGDPDRRRAYREGVRWWRDYYASEMRLLLEDGQPRPLDERLRGWLFVLTQQARSLIVPLAR